MKFNIQDEVFRYFSTTASLIAHDEHRNIDDLIIKSKLKANDTSSHLLM